MRNEGLSDERDMANRGMANVVADNVARRMAAVLAT